MHFRQLVTLLLTLPILVSAYNHPEIRWKSVETEHFVINYYNKTEAAVYPSWRITEEIYSALVEMFDYKPREKIAISLAEYDDFSNGWAEWTASNIMIWLPDSRFDLRSNTTWLRNVITHELSHIMSLEQKKRMQVLAFSLGLLIESPDEEYTFMTPRARITTFPAWLTEGIAQFSTEGFGNDCYDSRREMLLRCAIRSQTELTFDEMGHFNHDGIGSEMVYNQGFALTRYMAGKIGTKQLHSIFKAGSKDRIKFEEYFSENIGTSVRDLYDSWIDSLRATYAAKYSTIVEEHDIISNYGRFNLLPKISPDGKYISWFSSRKDDYSRSDLIIAHYGEKKQFHRIPYAHTAQCYSSTGDKIYYVKSRTPNRNGSYFNDIFSYSLRDGATGRITRDGRIYEIAALPGDDKLLCISFRKSAFGLYLCNPQSGKLTTVLEGEPGAPLVNVTVNPKNSSDVIVSKVVNGQSRLFRFIPASNELTPLGPAIGQEESPYWAKDGRIYFSADYDGIFSIYSILPDGSDLKRHGTTAGGYFSPLIGPDGNVVCSYYSAHGFSIIKLPQKSMSYSPQERNRCTFQPLPTPKGKVTIKARPYEADYRRSAWEIGVFGQLFNTSSILINQTQQYNDTLTILIGGGVTNYRTDALHKKQRLIQLNLGLANIFTSTNPDAPSLSLQQNQSKQITTIMKTPHLPISSGIDRFQEKKTSSYQGISPFDLTNPRLSQHLYRAQQSGTGEEDDTTATLNLPLMLISPGFAFENSSLAPTFGLEISASLLYMVMPQFIQCSPYLELQLGREWYSGARIDLLSMPLYGFPLFGMIPLYLSWVHPGYINEDISYNYADVTQMQIAAGPQFMPGYTDDSTSQVVNGWMADLFFFHGFPLFKYGALQLTSYTTANYHETATQDDMLFSTSSGEEPIFEGKANSYLFSLNGIRGVFPIVRTINKGGHRLYLDALYGYVGYNLSAYANNRFFDRFEEIDRNIFTDREYRKDQIVIDHVISTGFELGQYSSYLFFNAITLDFNYYILAKQFHLSLNVGF